jgi:serine kinase of HPr protein (carbohydrate metabolism regulator)
VSEIIHATSVSIGGRAVLFAGASGRGKSDIALRLIDRGAILVSDDYTALTEEDGRLYVSAPRTIAGTLEMRGVGLLSAKAVRDVPLCLHFDLDAVPERLPEPRRISLCGVAIPSVALAALEASAPIKVEAALALFGLPAP